MINFFIQTSDDSTHVIDHLINDQKNSDITEKQINQIQDIANRIDCEILYITNDFEKYSTHLTIGEDSRSYIVLVDDKNIENFTDSELQNVYLFVDDEEKFYENFKSIYKNIDGFIEFKFKDLSKYDIVKLKSSIEKIADLVLKSDRENSNLIVKQLNGYRIKEKFNGFGEISYFIGLDDKIYVHPNLYYSKSEYLCSVEEFEDNEMNYHYTRPHLACVSCETFWCNRDIYHNKIHTGEYKTPCIESCRLSTIFSKYSKNNFNKITGLDLDCDENLDRIDEFYDYRMYSSLLEDSVICNKIKGINFINRMMK